MEFMKRGARHTQPNSPAAGQTVPVNTNSVGTVAPNGSKGGGSKDKTDKFNIFKLFTALLFIAIIGLIIAVTAKTFFGGPESEAKHVDTSKYQAVFLNGGQVYFGKVKSLNSRFLRMQDIFYLQVNQQVQPGTENQQQQASDISLVKLGCELHGPQDEMIIKQDQVIFWENLKDDGQVAKAIAEYKTQNPNGQTCETPQNSGNGNGQTNIPQQQGADTNPATDSTTPSANDDTSNQQ